MIRRLLRLSPIALIVPLALIAAPLHAQSATGGIPRPWEGTPAWLNFEQGKRLYELKEFGQALLAFDRAIAARRDSFAEAGRQLRVALGSKQAKGAGGLISSLLAAFAAEDFLPKDYACMVEAAGGSSRRLFQSLASERISEAHRAFLGAMLAVLEYRPLEALGDSLKRLEAEIGELASFPEAEFWKGKVFALEGELPIAERQYLRAFDMRASLEIPEDRYTILYALADLYETDGDYVAWENVVKRILADDPVAGEPALDPFLRDAMMATLRNEGFDRFMTLYRIEPSFSYEANAAIAQFYLERGRASASLHAAVAAGMLATKAVAMLRARDRDYAWNGLADFRARAAARAEVAEYLDAREFDRMLLILADALYAQGSRTQASQLWRSVSLSGKAPYAAVAARRLESPSTALRQAASP